MSSHAKVVLIIINVHFITLLRLTWPISFWSRFIIWDSNGPSLSCFYSIQKVDSIFGRRGNQTEHEVVRRMKNEFMVNCDGLRTKDKERVLVLAATNRPFDLDEAVIRRLPRR